MAASSEPDSKKSCSSKLIGTHSGTFHCDEALACFMLKLLPEYKDARFDTINHVELDLDLSGLFLLAMGGVGGLPFDSLVNSF